MSWYNFHMGSRLKTLDAEFVDKYKGLIFKRIDYGKIKDKIKDGNFLIAIKCPHTMSKYSGKKTTVVIKSEKWEAFYNTMEAAYAWSEVHAKDPDGFNCLDDFEYLYRKIWLSSIL